MEPTPASAIGITLDPQGRPYDALYVGPGTSETRFLTVLHVAGGDLRIMDGNAIHVDPSAFAGEATEVDLGAIEDVRVSQILWRPAAGGTEEMAGVRIDVNGQPVQRWERFEPAYGTDGGVGGLTSQAVIDRAASLGDNEMLVPDIGADHLGDHDGLPGVDTFVFGNGYGDGGFPMARGLDGAGDLASLVIWSTTHHWRIAVPDGIPPADVTEREDQLQACIDGRRLINEHGYCT